MAHNKQDLQELFAEGVRFSIEERYVDVDDFADDEELSEMMSTALALYHSFSDMCNDIDEYIYKEE
jgi:hypothetical protein